MKRILLFITRYLCYGSNEVFQDELAKALEVQGADVTICNIMNRDDADTYLSRYIGQTFDAIIDFNSTLPRAMAGDTKFLDMINGPFFDYIVDHPLYHHPILSITLKNFHVICVDRLHAEYVKEHYSHIKSVHFMPLGVTSSNIKIPYQLKKSHILFTGTFYPISKYENLIEECEYAHYAKELAYMLIENPELTPEQAFDIVTGGITDNEKYNYVINKCYPGEIYARAYNRKKVLDAIVSSGIEVCICGNDWEKYDLIDNENVRHIKGVPYNEVKDIIASSKMLLNVLPGFRGGFHDRVLQGLVDKTLVVTDSNAYIDEELGDGVLIKYNLKDIDEIASSVCKYMNEEIEDKYLEWGYEYATEKASPESRAKQLLKMCEAL